jgi:O-succinylbenzoic acid--CoA ligase
MGRQIWTYRQLNEAVAAMASQLTAAGVDTGSRVAALLPNRVEYVWLIHALARLGATLVPLNIRLTPEELRWQLDRAQCALLVCADTSEAQATALDGNRWRTISVDPPTQPGVKALRKFRVDMAAGHHRPLDLEAIQGLVFTSGTTGRPKGALLTFANQLWGAAASAYRLGTDPLDRWLVCMPLYHIGGIAIIFRCCLYGTAVILQSGFEPPAVIRALQSQHISLVSLVPTMLQKLLEEHARALAASQLRCILLGGAAAPESLLARSLDLGLPVATTYGLTEATSQVATALPAAVRQKPGSVGKPLMFTQVRIVGEDGQALGPGELGEIIVSGPTVMRGYFGEPLATAETLVDGELHTADMGYVDPDGDLWIVQRRADLIVTGGENVYPAEVERVLTGHPNIAEACVVGLEDETWGQRVAAAVVIQSGVEQLSEQELVGYCRDHLAGYKCPRQIRFVTALPRTTSGKVVRNRVKQLVTEG